MIVDVVVETLVVKDVAVVVNNADWTTVEVFIAKGVVYPSR